MKNIPIPKQTQTQNQSKHAESRLRFKRSVSIEDVAVAALIKFYLKEMEAEKPGMARIILQELVLPSIATTKGQNIPTIDCAKLAQVIDAARDYAIHSSLNPSLLSSFMSTGATKPREAINADGDPLLERTLSYIDNDLLQGLSGKDYVSRMPIELADMVMECYGWFVVHQNS